MLATVETIQGLPCHISYLFFQLQIHVDTMETLFDLKFIHRNWELYNKLRYMKPELSQGGLNFWVASNSSFNPAKQAFNPIAIHYIRRALHNEHSIWSDPQNCSKV